MLPTGVDEAPFTPPEEFEEYRVVRLLGRGAMGQVFLAEDVLLRRPVAVKFVARRPSERLRDQFFVEARAIARLSHPNVVGIHRVGEIRGHPYLVSEYVHGRTLDKLERPMTWKLLISVAVGLARGLAAAHRRGVLHRDLKPTNAILAEDGEIKLLDFGLARIVDEARDVARAEVVGTPAYMPPEVWRGEPATRASDVYSMGVLLYELCAGRLPRDSTTPLDSLAVGADRGFAAIVDRCLRLEPKNRFPTGEALRDALEDLNREHQRSIVPEGNPYRGLLPFDADHRSVFFGREGEIREVLDRVRTEPFVLVSGESGAGKSSLCRAGVLPLARERCGFKVVELVPGRRPLSALAGAFAELLGEPSFQWTGHAVLDPSPVLNEVRTKAPEGVLLFVDQLEELITVADAQEASAFAEALGAVVGRGRVMRLLATLRSDFLARVAAMPGIGEEVGRALVLLGPMSPDAIREAIVGPARAKGFRFESEELVHTLLASAGGKLPSLQFALAALWDHRERADALVPAAALAAIGGVDGALARHADKVIDQLLPSERAAARRILCRLVTVEGTRVRRSEQELVATDPLARAALEAMVRGRLVVADEQEGDARGAFQIAHEALLTSWDALRGWLAADVEARALRHRLELAAAEWERLDRSPQALLNEAQLLELAPLDVGALGGREASFLLASRRVARRRKMLAASAILLLSAAVALTILVIRWRSSRELAAAVNARLSRADSIGDRARERQDTFQTARRRAFSLFDSKQWAEGERAWQETLAAARELDRLQMEASSNLEGALTLVPVDGGMRGRLADILYDRILLAESLCRGEQVSELSARLGTYDDGGARQRRLLAPGSLTIETNPPNAEVTVETYAERSGRLVPLEPRSLGRTRLLDVALAPASYVLTFALAGYATVTLPVLVARAERLSIAIALPRKDQIPDGFVFIPPGRFLFGSCAADEVRRGFLKTTPLHEVSTGPYLIARNESTMREWIDYLDHLPPAERRARSPEAQSTRSSIHLDQDGLGQWRLRLRPTQHTYEALSGEPLRYSGRSLRSIQDWSRIPVSGISYDDIVAYAAWLDRTGRVKGARLCDEYEWERAARGADGRSFPSGEVLQHDDANIDETYGREPLAFGPDEVGSHPGSRSPFRIDDLAGNVWERVRSVELNGETVNRGGGWYQGALSSRSTNRESGEPTMRHPFLGMRLCAAAPSVEEELADPRETGSPAAP